MPFGQTGGEAVPIAANVERIGERANYSRFLPDVFPLWPIFSRDSLRPALILKVEPLYR